MFEFRVNCIIITYYFISFRCFNTHKTRPNAEEIFYFLKFLINWLIKGAGNGIFFVTIDLREKCLTEINNLFASSNNRFCLFSVKRTQNDLHRENLVLGSSAKNASSILQIEEI